MVKGSTTVDRTGCDFAGSKCTYKGTVKHPFNPFHRWINKEKERERGKRRKRREKKKGEKEKGKIFTV